MTPFGKTLSRRRLANQQQHWEQAHGHIALTITLPPATLARIRHAARLRGEDCQHLIHEALESWLDNH